jgi:hypothetical protein
MQTSAHVFIIPILLSLVTVYGAFFKDWAKKQYEKGFIPGPKDLHAYIWTFRGLTLFALLLLITLYILSLTRG